MILNGWTDDIAPAHSIGLRPEIFEMTTLFDMGCKVTLQKRDEPAKRSDSSGPAFAGIIKMSRCVTSILTVSRGHFQPHRSAVFSGID